MHPNLTHQNMTRFNLIQSAVLVWIVTILLSIATGPLIKMCLSMDYDSNGLSVHEKLQSLNITISSDFGGIKDTTEQLFVCLTIFLACVVGLNIILTILMICPEVLHPKILYMYPVFLSVSTAAFVILTICLGVFYKNLFDGKIDPYNSSDLHGQMILSLKDNFRSDNFTTGTKISNDWNHLFIDFECCGVNRVAGTTNDFDETSWCTTNGSCQATASQIPKTCCKGFTEYDYQNAHSDCHSSVSPGYYYDKGCFSVIKKEVIKERIRLNSFVDDILTEGLRVVMVMGSFSFLSLVGMLVFIGICLKNKKNVTQPVDTEGNGTEPVDAENNDTERDDAEGPYEQINEKETPLRTINKPTKTAHANGRPQKNS